MVPKIEQDDILLLGHSIVYTEYDPTRFNNTLDPKTEYLNPQLLNPKPLNP